VKSKVVILVLTLVFAFGAVQTAAAGWGGKQMNAVPPVNMADELGLTAEQAAKIRGLQESHQKEMNALQDNIRELRLQSWQLSFTPGTDQKLLEAKSLEVRKLHEKKMELMQKHREEVRAILTDEQQARWSEVRNGRPCPNPDGPMRGPKGARGAGGGMFCPFGQTP